MVISMSTFRSRIILSSRPKEKYLNLYLLFIKLRKLYIYRGNRYFIIMVSITWKRYIYRRVVLMSAYVSVPSFVRTFELLDLIYKHQYLRIKNWMLNIQYYYNITYIPHTQYQFFKADYFLRLGQSCKQKNIYLRFELKWLLLYNNC